MAYLHVLDIMRKHDISQLPILKGGNIVGSISEKVILSYILSDPVNNLLKEVQSIMEKPFPEVSMDTSLKDVSKYLDRNVKAVVSVDNLNRQHIITQYDLIRAL